MYQLAPQSDPTAQALASAPRTVRRRNRLVAGALLVLVAAVTSACGGEDDDPAVSSSSTAQEPSPSTEAVPPAAPDTAAPSSPAPSSAADPGVDFVMPDLVGMDLQSAQDLVQTNGVFLSVSHDLLGSRNQVVDSNWIVCTQNVPAGQHVTGDVEGDIDFGVVKREESCP